MHKDYQLDDNEPEQKKFDLPSPKKHTFQVTDIYTVNDEMGQKLKLDEDTVSVKCEVVDSEEAGRTLLQRLTLNSDDKGFYYTRMFLKATSQDYKGKCHIDTDFWCGLRFIATVIHNGKYANIDEYDFDNKPAQINRTVNPGGITDPKDIQW
jgi:hypothetical protein